VPRISAMIARRTRLLSTDIIFSCTMGTALELNSPKEPECLHIADMKMRDNKNALSVRSRAIIPSIASYLRRQEAAPACLESGESPLL
jgi:hypothetical protein